MKKKIKRLYYKLGFPIRQYLRGIGALNGLIRRKREDEVYVLLTYNIGDDVYGLSYVRSLKEKYHEPLTIFCRRDRQRLVESYDGSYDHIESLERSSKGWNEIWAISNSKYLIRKAINNKIFPVLPFHYIPLGLDDGRTELDYIRTNLFNLDISSVIQYPSLPEIPITSIENFENIKQRIVVINPYSLSMDSSMFGFYNKISSFLSSEGYLVYTNVVGEQKALDHSQPLNCSIYEFYSICDKIPLVISTRTGLMDLCISAKTKFFVFYFPFGDNAYMYPKMSVFYNRFTLKAWGTNNVEECVYQDEKTAFSEFELFFDTNFAKK